MLQTPPLSIYIHIPWCESKCPYCDFNSHTGDIQEEQYQAALCSDLAETMRLHPYLKKRSIHSIFIGGGTPSLLSGRFYAALLDRLRMFWQFSPDLEITLESNPSSAEAKRFKDYVACGINRLSIGAQSFADEMLLSLGRRHNRRQIFAAREAALAAGFKRINLDLMFALPGQSIQQAMQDLNLAVKLDCEHISWYQLTCEPGTRFYSAPPPHLPNEGLVAEIEEKGLEILQGSDFSRYEISAYSRNILADKGRCRHNLNYWQFGDYLGLGAGAHSKLTSPNGDILRVWRKRGPLEYINSAPIDTPSLAGSFAGGSQWLEPEDRIFEFMLNALRLVQGFDSQLFEERTGLAWRRLARSLNTAVEGGLITMHKHRIAPTSRGLSMLNDLCLLFMPQPSELIAQS